jgi:hypothetical protein
LGKLQKPDSPVPVDCRALFGSSDVVVDGNLNHITPVDLYKRAGKLAVHGKEALLCNVNLN